MLCLILALQVTELDALRYLARHQSESGAWGEKPRGCSREFADGKPDLETTAVALLAFLEAGYADSSKDEHDGISFGGVVRRGVEWLVARQGETPAPAALVLTELSGLTGRRPPAAERAAKHVEEGSRKDTWGRIWQGAVLKSAEIAGIGGSRRERIGALSRELASDNSDLAFAGRLLLDACNGTRSADPQLKRLYGARASALPVAELWLYSVALFHGDSDPARWHTWFRELRRTLSSEQRRDEKACDRGSWSGGNAILVTSYRALTVAHYRCFHCRNAFRKD